MTANKKTKTKKSFWVRLTSLILIVTLLMSTVTMLVTSAATDAQLQEIRHELNKSGKTPIAIVNMNLEGSSAIADGIFDGAASIISIVSVENPVAGVIASGFLGAFKSFYNSEATSGEPTTQDIVNMLEAYHQELQRHHDEEMSQLNFGLSQDKLQGFATKLTSALGYNRFGVKHIGAYTNPGIEDYKIIVSETIDKEGLLNTFTDMSTYLTMGDVTLRGKPVFRQYLEGAAGCSANNYNYDCVKEDALMFCQVALEQYCLLYTVILTGYMAKYEMLELQYANGEITLAAKQAAQKGIQTNMNEYTDMCADVAAKYYECCETVNNMKAAEVTINGVTTPVCSVADAWVKAVTAGGEAEIKLTKNVEATNFFSDHIQYNNTDCFKNGVFYLKDHSSKITFDLNGYKIANTPYTFYIENSNILIKDSAKSGEMSGIYATDATIAVEGVRICNAPNCGIYAKGGKATVSNVYIYKSASSGIYNKDCNMNVTGCTVDSCATTDNGGGIYNNSRNMTVTSTTINSCSAVNGGGIYSVGTITVKNCQINNCTATADGGGICVGYLGSGYTSTTDVYNTKITYCNAGRYGGGMYADSMSYLNMEDTAITNNKAGSQGGGLFCQKGTASSCDPVISGVMTITDNTLNNGTKSNAFLQENTTSKCIFVIGPKLLSNKSRIGISSNTNDGDLDIVKIDSKDGYDQAQGVFSYDTSAYKINYYTHWYSLYWWVEIVKN